VNLTIVSGEAGMDEKPKALKDAGAIGSAA